MRKSSFGGTSRLSSGPLRVKNDGGVSKKKSSFTPQKKRYSGASTSKGRPSVGVSGGASSSRASSGLLGLGGRTSGIGVRGSGIGSRGGTSIPKDPRPVSDKAYQRRNIEVLIEFLMDNKYPHQISQKVLMSPPSKEFFNIFTFIYSLINPSFKMEAKMDEVVPRVLKNLGYPFQISRSSMHAVGTPHTWPYLLAALIWLVELVKYGQGLNHLDKLIFPPDNDDFDSTPDEKLMFNYNEQAYHAYLAGSDEFDEIDEELQKVLEDKYLGQSGGMSGIRNECARIIEEIQICDQEMGRVDKLREEQEIMLLDKRKFEDYLGELETVMERKKLMLNDADQDIQGQQQELASVKAKNEHMQAIWEQQELTPQDVERLRLDRQELARQEESLEREEAVIDQEIWKEEMASAKDQEQLTDALGEYSKLARAQCLIGAEGSLANGIDFELQARNDTLSDKFEGIIKPALVIMKKKKEEAMKQLQRQQLAEEANLEQLAEQISDARDEANQLEKDVRTKDEELECRKQLYQRDIESLQNNIEDLEKEIRGLRMSQQMSLQDTEKELRQTQTWAEKELSEMNKKEKEYTQFLIEVTQLVIDHKTYIQTQMKSLDKDVSELLAQEQERTKRMEADTEAISRLFDHNGDS